MTTGDAKAEQKGKAWLDLGGWLPDQATNPSKREFEIFALQYTVVWIATFAVVGCTYTSAVLVVLV